MDTDMGLLFQAVRVVDQEHTVLACMDTHLGVVDIHKAKEGRGMGKKNSRVLPLKMESLLMSTILKIS